MSTTFKLTMSSSSLWRCLTVRMCLFQVSLTLACPMNLKLFPLDTQVTAAELGNTVQFSVDLPPHHCQLRLDLKRPHLRLEG